MAVNCAALAPTKSEGLHMVIKAKATIEPPIEPVETPLMKNAIQEMFRYDPPLPYFHRYALEDMTYKGREFKKGTMKAIDGTLIPDLKYQIDKHAP